MAAVWKVPVVFVIENNLYGEYSPLRETTPLDDLAERAKALRDARRDRRRPGRRRGPRDRLGRGRARARRRGADADRGEDLPLPRPLAHRPGEVPRRGRARALEAARPDRHARAPSSRRLLRGRSARAARARSRPRWTRAAARAARGARSRPSRRSRTMSTQLETEAPPRRGRRRRAVVPRGDQRRARGRARGRPDACCFMGEDVATAGGVFKTNEGLSEKFGRERVRTRRSARTASSASRSGWRSPGMRPVVEIMFSDFLPTAGDAIVERAAEVPLHVGRAVRRCRVTVRSIGGATGRFGTQHSATGESWYIGPAGPEGRDGRHARVGLRRAARRDPRRRPGALLRAQGPLRPQGPGARAATTGIAPGRQGRRCCARAPTSRSSRRC